MSDAAKLLAIPEDFLRRLADMQIAAHRAAEDLARIRIDAMRLLNAAPYVSRDAIIEECAKVCGHKAYVTAHFPAANATQRNGRGRDVIGWYVHVPGIPDVTGNVTWHFRGSTAALAWQAAAEVIANKLRRGSP